MWMSTGLPMGVGFYEGRVETLTTGLNRSIFARAVGFRWIMMLLVST